MKKIKSIIACLFVLFAAASVHAADISLEKVCGDLAKNAVTRGDFTQIKSVASAKGTRDLKSYGKFVFCVQGIMWDTTKPFASSMIVTKDKIVQKASDGTKSVIDGKDNQIFGNVASTLTALFSGDLSALKKNFNTSISGSAASWQITLIPNDATLAGVMKKIVLGGSSTSSSSTLETIAIEEASGSTIKYIFENHSYSKELTSNEKSLFSQK